MKKILLIILGTYSISASEYLNEIIVAESLPQPQIKIIEQETQINEQTLDQKLFNSVMVNQMQDTTNSKVISIRGNNYRATNYYEDGIELYRTANGFTDLSMYYTNNSNIEINPGGSQGIYGASATGGDVYINSKKLKNGFHASIDTTLSTNDMYISTQLSQKSDDYYFQLQLNGLKQNSFKLPNSFDYTTIQNNNSRVNSDKQQFDGSLKVGYTIDNNSDIAFKISHMKGEYGNPIQTYDEPSNPFGANADYTRIDDKELNSYWFFYNYEKDDIKLNVRAYYDEYTDVFNFYTSPTFQTLLYDSSRYNDTRLGALTSLDYTYNQHHNGKLTLKVEKNTHQQVIDNNPVNKNYETHDISFSYLHEYKMSDKLSFALSAIHKQQIPIKVFDFNTTTTEDYKDNSAVDIQLTSNYVFNENQTYYASVSRKNRFASLTELYPFFPWNTLNTSVKPEQSDNFEIGSSLKVMTDTLLNISLYHNTISDMIVYEGDSFINKEEVKINGAEVHISNYSLKNHDLEVSYAYTDARDNNGDKIVQIPASKLFLQDTFEINNNTKFMLSYLHVGKRDDIYNSTRYQLSSYSLVDTQASYEASRSLLFKCGVKNLFDSEWEFTHGQPSLGRSYFVSFNYTY